MAHDDPHAEIHDLASGQHEDHPPVAVGEGTWQEELAKVNKELTKRVNDIRRDFDTTKKAVSGSVAQIAGDLGTLKTSVENNTDAIEAQDKLIENATKKADAAKTAADAATTGVEEAKAKIAEVQNELLNIVEDLRTEYEGHTHGVAITLQGETQQPKANDETEQTPEGK